jgi:hypothetical protein
MQQDVVAANLVVEHIEAEGGLRLRLHVKLPLKGPDFMECCEAQKSGPFAPPALPGLDAHTALSDSRRSHRLMRCRYPRQRRVSLVARTTMRTCRAHYPGGSERVHVSIASPFHAAFPKLWAGRHPHCPFRGLLRLHSRYGPHACSTAQGGLCHGLRRDQLPGHAARQLPAQSTTRWVEPSSTGVRAFEAHQSFRTCRRRWKVSDQAAGCMSRL